MEAKETFGDGCGRKYAHSPYSTQNRAYRPVRQEAIHRVSTMQNSMRGPTDSLAAETHSHINSAGCEEMAMTITAAHHSIYRHLYDSMHAAQKPKNNLKFVTLDKENNLSTLWRQKSF